MLSFLDPKVWLALFLVAAISGGYGYYKGHSDGAEINENKWLLKAAESAKALKAKEDQHEKAVSEVATKLEEEKTNAYEVAKQRDAAIRAGTLRLSVPTVTARPTENSTAATADKETRTFLDTGTSIALVALAEVGDDAIRNLNSCIDAYEALRK